MNIYMAAAALNLQPGLVIFNNNQARRRLAVLVQAKQDIDELDLSDDELALITPKENDLFRGEPETINVYKLIAVCQIKAGEIFGYDGELNRQLAQLALPAPLALEEVEKTAEAEALIEIDQKLLDAIDELDPANGAHFTTQGKPEIDVLKALIHRKVTGKERDEAWKFYTQPLSDERRDELLIAIDMLKGDDIDAADFDIDGIVNGDSLAETIDSGVTQFETGEAINAWKEKQAELENKND